jgi:hypothetical protein
VIVEPSGVDVEAHLAVVDRRHAVLGIEFVGVVHLVQPW